ncbi:hypothetical protein HEP_00032200 [Hepatocystis sp. ex Piliocolobus tephrosceles]|nr:hypothetical protein HEP_00032200 [Hepatocystis sp. ex Piliocolobus tephrosceles]
MLVDVAITVDCYRDLFSSSVCLFVRSLVYSLDNFYKNGENCNGENCNGENCNGENCNGENCNGENCNGENYRKKKKKKKYL